MDSTEEGVPRKSSSSSSSSSSAKTAAATTGATGIVLTPALLREIRRPGPCAPHETLDLSGKKLSVIQDTGDVGSADSPLRKLNLATNSLTRLNGLHRLTSLTWLNANSNKLVSQALVDLNHMSNLSFLGVGHNSITALPPNSLPASLRALIANNNKLKEIRHIGHLNQLNSLVLSHNLLSDVGGELLLLQKLSKLSLSNNQLTALPDLSGLPELAELRINNNMMLSLPVLPASLRLIDAGSNKLTSIAPLSLLSRLVNVNIRGNPVCSELAGKAGTRYVYTQSVLAQCPAVLVLDGQRVERPEKTARKRAPGGSAAGASAPSSGSSSAAPGAAAAVAAAAGTARDAAKPARSKSAAMAPAAAAIAPAAGPAAVQGAQAPKSKRKRSEEARTPAEENHSTGGASSGAAARDGEGAPQEVVAAPPLKDGKAAKKNKSEKQQRRAAREGEALHVGGAEVESFAGGGAVLDTDDVPFEVVPQEPDFAPPQAAPAAVVTIVRKGKKDKKGAAARSEEAPVAEKLVAGVVHGWDE